LGPAFAAWLASRPFTNPDAPSSPFVMPQYRLADTVKAERLAATATVTKLKSLRQQEVVLALGWLIFLASAVWIATLPVTFSF
jgi:hypothetical protein